MDRKILHLITDEKFFWFVHDVFEQTPGVSNRWVAFVKTRDARLVHIANLPLWRTVIRGYFFSHEMEEDLNWCDCLIVHCMSTMGARMILQSPSHVTVVWSGWGVDYYRLLPGGRSALLGAETKTFVDRFCGSDVNSLIGKVRGAADLVRQYCLLHLYWMPAMSRVDLFSAPIPEDYELLRRALGKRLRADYVQLNYGSVERSFQVGLGGACGNDILVGNSSAMTNNHAEAFRILARKDLSGRRVIVPLSYGAEDCPKYRDYVIRLGESLFGSGFVPILNFMSLPDYNALIASCSTVVMAHKRQQALGNIGALMYSGARVYFDRANPIYGFLKKRGAHVFVVEEIAHNEIASLQPLSEEQRSTNREVLKSFWGQNVVLENTRRFAALIAERHKNDDPRVGLA